MAPIFKKHVGKLGKAFQSAQFSVHDLRSNELKLSKVRDVFQGDQGINFAHPFQHKVPEIRKGDQWRQILDLLAPRKG